MTGTHQEQQAAQRWPRGVPDAAWAPLAAGALMLVVGGLGFAFGQPLLFPSLGPTAFLQTESPELPTARLYNTVVGHGIGLAAGFFAVFALGAQDTPGVLASQHIPLVRLWAAFISIVATLLVGYLLRASHPPAAATTLLIALGSFAPTAATVRAVVLGVLIVAIAGEALRRLRSGHGKGHGRERRSLPR